MNQQELIKQFKKYSEPTVPLLSLSAKEKVKQRVLNNLSTKQYQQVDAPKSLGWTFMFTRIAVTAVCVLALLTGTTYASFSSLPGDALYPLKRTVEDTQVKLTQNPETKAKLQVKLAEKRFHELESLEEEYPKVTPPAATNNTSEVKIDVPKEESVTASPIPSPTETEEVESEDNPKENFAKREISRAILNLENTKTKLEKNGHTEEANNLSITIKEFTSRAEMHRKRRMSPKDKETPKEEAKAPNRQKESKNEQENKENR